MKTKKSLNPQIVAPVERTTTTSRNNAGSLCVDAAWTIGNNQYNSYGMFSLLPFSGDDAE